MEAAALKSLEDRAASAERRIADLEKKLASGAPASSRMDVQRYIAELQALRQVLVAAQTEQAAQETRIAELEAANLKLAYQIKHLKTAVQAGDKKLAAAGISLTA